MTTVTTIRQDTEAERRAAYIKGLRALADVLETHDEVRLPYDGNSAPLNIMFLFGDDPRAEIAAAARAIPCKWRKRVTEHHDGTANFYLDGELHGLKLTLLAYRDAVCERIVTGTREVTETVKDPDALAKVPEIEVTKTVDEVEWRCHPVLAPAAQPESQDAA